MVLLFLGLLQVLLLVDLEFLKLLEMEDFLIFLDGEEMEEMGAVTVVGVGAVD